MLLCYVVELNSQSVSWCKIEAWVSSPIHMTPIKDISLPPLVILAVATKTYPNLKTHQNEVLWIIEMIDQFLRGNPVNKYVVYMVWFFFASAVCKVILLFDICMLYCILRWSIFISIFQVVAIAGLIHNKFSIDKPPPKPNFQHTFCGKRLKWIWKLSVDMFRTQDHSLQYTYHLPYQRCAPVYPPTYYCTL